MVRDLINWILELTLGREQRIRLGRNIFCHARGLCNFDPPVNGEYRIVRILAGSFPPDAIFFDIGVNFGEWSQYILGLTQDSKVYAFEPATPAFRRATDAIRNAGLEKRVQLFQWALGDRGGEAQLHLMGHTAGSHSLHLRHAETSGIGPQGSELVRVARGDEVCRDLGIRRIHFAKIDTEGHEVFVLRGFEEMLSAGMIDCLQFEYDPSWIDSRTYLLDVFEFLLPKGYMIARLHPDGIEVFDKYDQRQETFLYCNYIAFLPELLPKLGPVVDPEPPLG